jgi:hypothetical protein
MECGAGNKDVQGTGNDELILKKSPRLRITRSVFIHL